MKILSVIIMSKKGQNLFVATANNFTKDSAIRYGVQIYDYFLFISRQGKKVDKIISIDVGITCNVSSYGEIFILVLVSYYQASLGSEATKKLASYFKINQKEDYLNKKFLEIQQSLEDFLYSRDFNSQKQFNTKIGNPNERQMIVNGSGMSQKQQADFEVFSSFLEMDSVRDSRERNAIAVVPMKYWTKTKSQISRMKAISSCTETISLSLSRDSSKNKQTYHKVIGQLKNQRYRCAYKVATKVAAINQSKQTQRTPHPTTQQFEKNQNRVEMKDKFASISSNDVKNSKIPLSQKLILQQQNNLLDLDLDSSPVNNTPATKREPIFQKSNKPAVPHAISSNINKPAVQPQINSIRNINYSINLLDSDEEEDPQPQQSKPNQNIVNTTTEQTIKVNQPTSNLINISNQASTTAPTTKVAQQTQQTQDQKITLDQANNPNTPTTIKISESIQIEQQDSGFPQGVKMHGQILISGNFKDDIIQINLKGKNWVPTTAKHRSIPNSYPSRTNSNNTSYQQNKYSIYKQIETFISNELFRIKVDKAQISIPKPVIEILLNNAMFVTIQQVPIYFIYKLEVQMNNSVNFKFQYMVNSRWAHNLEEVEFHIILDENLIFSDIQPTPVASSFQNKVLLWKTSRLSNQQKGFLNLSLNGVNLPPKDILKYVRLKMKSESVCSELDAELLFNNCSETVQSQKKMFIEYKILPNSK